MLVFNAHMHLNGSIRPEFLKAIALRNNCLNYFEGFMAETDLWKKFGWVHKIIQTTEDIRLATLDVVKHSTADVLEIRTTAKPLGNHSSQDYIAAFVAGLKEANQLYPNKRARGLLSIDRTRHNLEEAKEVVNAALAAKQEHGMIVGIDLSGNFAAPRTLSGNDLYQAISYALHKDIGVALHIGEIDSDIERQDVDFLLKAIEEYQQEKGGKLYGKVRLGHAIYRTPEQDARIAALKIPVEICPSCHEILDWWKKDQPHPILTLYQKRSQVIAGTDDDLLFHCHAKGEQAKLDALFQGEDDTNKTSQKRLRYMFS
ncbi:MAG: hypothetical protein AB7I18_04665 [Candidatus Berkiella sp.]